MVVWLKKSVQAHFLQDNFPVLTQVLESQKKCTLLLMQCLNWNLCPQMRCFNPCAQFCTEIEDCHLITSRGSWWAVSVIGLSCITAAHWCWGTGPMQGCIIQSCYEVGTNMCKMLAAPCQKNAADLVCNSMQHGQFKHEHGCFLERNCTARRLHHRTRIFPLQPRPAVYVNWCKSQCEVSPNCLASLGP